MINWETTDLCHKGQYKVNKVAWDEVRHKIAKWLGLHAVLLFCSQADHRLLAGYKAISLAIDNKDVIKALIHTEEYLDDNSEGTTLFNSHHRDEWKRPMATAFLFF